MVVPHGQTMHLLNCRARNISHFSLLTGLSTINTLGLEANIYSHLPPPIKMSLIKLGVHYLRCNGPFPATSTQLVTFTANSLLKRLNPTNGSQTGLSNSTMLVYTVVKKLLTSLMMIGEETTLPQSLRIDEMVWKIWRVAFQEHIKRLRALLFHTTGHVHLLSSVIRWKTRKNLPAHNVS